MCNQLECLFLSGKTQFPNPCPEVPTTILHILILSLAAMHDHRQDDINNGSPEQK